MHPFHLPGQNASRRANRAEALAELTREAEEIYRRRREGEISIIEAERLLSELRDRYKTPLDTFLAAG